MIQFTSGSTRAPRGVVLEHRHVLANLAAIRTAFGLDDRPMRVVSWLPPYHDMGLVGSILSTLYCGGTAVLMSPLHFLQRPARWLRAIATYGADVSGGPNFAYDLCARKVDPAESIDLATWRVAYNGAEVVRADTLARFAARFAGAGFRSTAWFPCYGLAETGLMASGGHDPAIVDGRVASGPAVPTTRIAIVVDGAEVPDGELGEIWLAGPSIGGGYDGLPDETARVFGAHLATGEGPFLRTGDLGFVRDGSLVVTGRASDAIIVRGRNLWPDDLERDVVEAHPQLRPGCTAVFGVEHAGEERIVVVQEIDRAATDRAAIARAIRAGLDVVPLAIVLLDAGTIPKTSSGKVQRHACRDAFLRGEIRGE